MDIIQATHVLVRKHVRNLLNEIDTQVVELNEWQYTEARKLYDYFGINQSNLTRNGKDYPDVFFQDPPEKYGTWFIRIEFVPWLVAKSISNHSEKSSDSKKRRIDFLNKIGIPVPDPIPYLYFADIIEKGLIKIGITANYSSGNRMAQLEQKFGPCKWRKVIQHDKAEDLEKILLDFFSDLHVADDCFRLEEKLTNFIDDLGKDPEKAADQIKRLKGKKL